MNIKHATDAIAIVQFLSDAEHHILQRWLISGGRDGLSYAGVDWAFLSKPLFEGDIPTLAATSSPVFVSHGLNRIVQQVFARGGVVADELRYWFMWGSREYLIQAGLSDSEIGPMRLVPDDADYPDVRDGTLERFECQDGTWSYRLFLAGQWRIEPWGHS